MEGYQVLDHERGEGVMEEEEVGRGEHLTLASPVFMEQLFWTFPQILHRILEIKMETQAPDPKFRDPAQQSCSKCLGRAGRSFCASFVRQNAFGRFNRKACSITVRHSLW